MKYKRTIVIKANSGSAYFERTAEITAPLKIDDDTISEAIKTAYQESRTKSADDVLQRMSIYLANYHAETTVLQPERNMFEINDNGNQPTVTKINVC